MPAQLFSQSAMQCAIFIVCISLLMQQCTCYVYFGNAENHAFIIRDGEALQEPVAGDCFP